MKHIIDTFLEPALWFAADWSLRWAALLAVVALMLWIVRPRRAAIRQSMLLTALSAGVLVPFAPRWGGGWERIPKESAPPPQASPPSRDREGVGKASLPHGRGSAPIPRSLSRHEETTTAHLAEPLGRRRLIVFSLVSCWSFTVLFLLIRRLGGWLVLRRLRRESMEATGATADLFAACRTEMHIRGAVRLAAHPRVRSPILLGFLRPMILVPPDWPQRAIEAQRAALLHELAHVRRRDHLLALLMEIVRIAFFFHPLVRWLLGRLDYERELLCDEMVVRQGIDPRDYARLLLEFARASGRLAWPAASLPMSRRRTVKGRIHHLLEEDMERWIRPLPARWGVVLGACLLALTLGLASYRVVAEEKAKAETPAKKAEKQPASNKPAAAAIKREDLRYGGKDFHQWRRELVTELKPAIRIDGLTALRAFGCNGYGDEATQAILDMMRGYDPLIENTSEEDAPVVQAGYKAIHKIGAAAVPALTAAVKNENRNVRRFAITSLGRLGRDAQAAIPALLQALKKEDLLARRLATDAVGMIGRGNKEVVAALIEALKDNTNDVRDAAASALGDLGESAKPAIPALLKALSDKDDGVRIMAIQSLQQIGAGAKAVPAVIRLLRDENGNVWQRAFRYLQNLKPEEAKEAIPALIAIVKTKDDPRIPKALAILKSMGPKAKEAIPALNELLRREEELRSVRSDPHAFIMGVIKAIDPEGNR
ncbi:MAG: HEAT repeat domain-containing protein [Gemmataceae bacterium]